MLDWHPFLPPVVLAEVLVRLDHPSLILIFLQFVRPRNVGQGRVWLVILIKIIVYLVLFQPFQTKLRNFFEVLILIDQVRHAVVVSWHVDAEKRLMVILFSLETLLVKVFTALAD